jgi:hypothetical protein
VSEDQKKINIVSETEMGGMAFLEGGTDEGPETRKVNLRVVGSISDSISLGVGDVEKLRELNFVSQGTSWVMSEL